MAASMVRCVDASAFFSEVVGSSDSLSVFLQSFVVDKKIGKGQFSEVFRARSNETGTAVALKKIKVPFSVPPSNSRGCSSCAPMHSLSFLALLFILILLNYGYFHRYTFFVKTF